MSFEAICGHCGRTFTAQRVSARYCSAACRQGARRGTYPAGRDPALEELRRRNSALARSLADVLGAVPHGRRRKLLAHIAAALHPDGPGRRPETAAELLLLVNRLRDKI